MAQGSAGLVCTVGDHLKFGQTVLDGGLGSNWYADPREGLNGIMMTQVCWTSPVAPDQFQDFWTTLYQALDD